VSKKRIRIRNAVLAFMIGYPLCLVSWIQLRPYYAKPLVRVGAELSALTIGGQVDEFSLEAGVATVSLSAVLATPRGVADLVVDGKLKTDNYTFNVPLTVALLVSAWWIFRWPWHAYLEASLLITGGHLLYVYSYLCLHFLGTLVKLGAVSANLFRDTFWQFLWAFTDNLLIRFEPFLIPVILWLIHEYGRGTRSEAVDTVSTGKESVGTS
jgi:hypothetical protein